MKAWDRWLGVNATQGDDSRARGQVAWAIGDQALSSGTNFLIAIVVARVLGPKEFGIFVLVSSVFLAVLGLIRNLVMQPFTLRASPVGPDAWRPEACKGAGASVAVGFVAGFIMLTAGLIVGPATVLGRSLMVVGAFSGPLVLQDFWRAAAFSRRAAQLAFWNDATWVIVQGVVLLCLYHWSALTSPKALAAWGLGALAGAVLGIAQLRAWPAYGAETLEWARDVWSIGSWFGAAGGTFALSEQAGVWIVGGIAGPASLGGLRAVESLFGPAKLLSAAAESAMLPLAARSVTISGSVAVIRLARRYAALLASAIGAFSVLILLAGSRLLTAVFGTAFADFADLMMPVAITVTFGGIAAGATLGLRALGRGRRLFLGQLAAATGRILSVLVGAAVFGLRGAAWGLAAASGWLALVMWRQLLRSP